MGLRWVGVVLVVGLVAGCADGGRAAPAGTTAVVDATTAAPTTTASVPTTPTPGDLGRALDAATAAAVAAGSPLEDVFLGFGALSVDELADRSGTTPADLTAALRAAWADLAPKVATPGRSAPRLRFLNPFAALGGVASDGIVQRMGRQRDPEDDTYETKAISTTTKNSVGSATAELTIDIAGVVARVEGASWTISTSWKTTGRMSSPTEQIELVDDATLSIKATSCPDGSGRAPFEIGLHVESAIREAGATKLTSVLDVDIVGAAVADDEAEKAATELATTLHRTMSKPGEPDVEIDTPAPTVSTFPATGAPTAVGGAWTYRGTNEQAAQKLLGSSQFFPQFQAIILADEMAKAWKSGLCVKARVDSGASRTVDRGEEVELVVAAEHRIEQRDVALPIDAKLEGPASIDPAGKRQPAPATFRYTAGPNARDEGKVTVQVISRRGKSRPVTETYRVTPGYTVNASGVSGAYAVTGPICDLAKPFALAWSAPSTFIDGTMTFTPTAADGTTGTWSFTGKSGGQFAVSADGGYAADPSAPSVSLTSQSWSVDAPFAGTQALGPNGQHVRLNEAIPLSTEPAPAC